MNWWRVAFVALAALLVGFVAGSGVAAILATTVLAHAPAPEPQPVAMLMPIKAPKRPRVIATVKRFGKVFAFVALGLFAAALASPEGMRVFVEPLNVLTMVVASSIGAALKFFQWQDITAEAPPTVTLALSAPTKAESVTEQAPGGVE